MSIILRQNYITCFKETYVFFLNYVVLQLLRELYLELALKFRWKGVPALSSSPFAFK